MGFPTSRMLPGHFPVGEQSRWPLAVLRPRCSCAAPERVSVSKIFCLTSEVSAAWAWLAPVDVALGLRQGEGVGDDLKEATLTCRCWCFSSRAVLLVCWAAALATCLCSCQVVLPVPRSLSMHSGAPSTRFGRLPSAALHSALQLARACSHCRPRDSDVEVLFVPIFAPNAW